MFRKNSRINPLESRKQLLIAASELNRTQMIQEWQMMTEGVRTFGARMKSIGSLASAAAMGAGLSDSDLAAVITYIRSSWGNKGEPVTPDDVKAVRAAVAGKPAISGEAQLKPLTE